MRRSSGIRCVGSKHIELTTTAPCIELIIYIISACQIQAVGVASHREVPSDRFSASSWRSGYEPSEARLNGNGAWSPRTDSDAIYEYLQIDLKYVFFICAVATQGNPIADQWTTKYQLLLSLDNTNWVTYKENGITKVCNE